MPKNKDKLTHKIPERYRILLEHPDRVNIVLRFIAVLYYLPFLVLPFLFDYFSIYPSFNYKIGKLIPLFCIALIFLIIGLLFQIYEKKKLLKGITDSNPRQSNLLEPGII